MEHREVTVNMENQGASHRVGGGAGDLVSLVACVAFLAATWYVLFIVTAAMVESLLVPWDLVYVEDRPPLGSWDRTVNDFFEGQPGSVLPSGAIIAASAGLFVLRARRAARRDRLAVVFAATNLLSLPMSLLLMNVGYAISSQLFPQPHVPFDVGFHRTAFPAVAAALAFTGLLIAQSRLKGRYLEAPNSRP